jgi:diguanylate cyclase (GGDEF)-like protein
VSADTQVDSTRSSPAAEQLERGFRWLRFEPQLEEHYQRERHEQGLTHLRFNLVLALGLVLAFVSMDRGFMPDTQARVALLRYAVVLPSLGLCLVVSFIPRGWRLYMRLVKVLAPVVLVAIVALILGADPAASAAIFPGLVLASVFIYYLVGLTFYGALLANLIGLGAFAAGAAAWTDIPGQQTSYQAMVLLFGNIVGATVAYNLERARRTGWLEALMLAEMAERDGLTGTYNRRRLDGHLRRAWQQGIREHAPMALLMIDIDCFKAYNDRYGHQAGDEALKSVASVLARCARRPLDFVARYGGEEFLVVLYDTTRDYAGELARKIMEGIRELNIPHATSGVSPVLSVSIGVAYVQPVAGRSHDGFVQLADEALYAAKHRGRNCVHVMESEYAQLRTGSFRIAKR